METIKDRNCFTLPFGYCLLSPRQFFRQFQDKQYLTLDKGKSQAGNGRVLLPQCVLIHGMTHTQELMVWG